MSKAREITTRIEDLRKGDTVRFEGTRHNVIAAIREPSGAYTLRIQVPGTPVRTFHQADPGFTFTRIAR
jgi:hypothetical protein